MIMHHRSIRGYNVGYISTSYFYRLFCRCSPTLLAFFSNDIRISLRLWADKIPHKAFVKKDHFLRIFMLRWALFGFYMGRSSYFNGHCSVSYPHYHFVFLDPPWKNIQREQAYLKSAFSHIWRCSEMTWCIKVSANSYLPMRSQ